MELAIELDHARQVILLNGLLLKSKIVLDPADLFLRQAASQAIRARIAQSAMRMANRSATS